jgi:hypothetical protein
MGAVPYLLRVVMPDRPGTLGAVATAIGEAGGDIVGIEVVEHRADGTAIDDVTLDLPPGRMPDALVSACESVDGVHVEFVGSYAAGANLQRDLEAIEAMTTQPDRAEQVLVELVPGVFPGSWGLLLEQGPDGRVRRKAGTPGAPGTDAFSPPWLPLATACRVVADGTWAPPSWRDVIAAVAPLGSPHRVVVAGRYGGPETLDSEVVRLAHLAALADTVRRVGRIA